jgi:uncharacterized protein (TIGR04141 family)
MRVNVFRIPPEDVEACQSKLIANKMSVIKEVDQAGWQGAFYYSSAPDFIPVRWGKTYADFFTELNAPRNLSYWAAFMFRKKDRCFVLSYGKAHFYLRPYCDHDFGIEVAKRIANERDTRLTAGRRFQGTKKKDIKSFASNTALAVESGESVDYIQAGIAEPYRPTFGKTAKFGSSALLTPDIEPSGIGSFLDKLEVELAKAARFPLPRTTIVTEKAEIERFDELLLDELTTGLQATDFTHNSFDLFGVDFTFANDGDFTIKAPYKKPLQVDHLSVGDLKHYVVQHNIKRESILKISVRHDPEDSVGFDRPLKETLDFIADGENVLLSGGKWMYFNQDYLDFLDDFLRSIEVEDTEPEFREIFVDEPTFNTSDAVKDAGYEVADKNFSIVKTKAKTPIEAWDLRKGSTVYAVKFATPQKLGYVCDQATAVLELKRNKAGVKKMPAFERYCLWLGYRSKKPVDDITRTGSIILKQKLETWARKAREVGVEPAIKLSRKMKPGVDET